MDYGLTSTCRTLIRRNSTPSSFSAQTDLLTLADLSKNTNALRMDRTTFNSCKKNLIPISTNASSKEFWDCVDYLTTKLLFVDPEEQFYEALCKCLLELAKRTFTSFCNAFLKCLREKHGVLLSFLEKVQFYQKITLHCKKFHPSFLSECRFQNELSCIIQLDCNKTYFGEILQMFFLGKFV